MTYEEEESRYTEQAQRALARYMERQRQERSASQNPEQDFSDGEISASVDAGADEGESDHADAKQSALEYAQARNSGTRVRAYAQDNESQREGVQAALSWLQRKRKSAITK